MTIEYNVTEDGLRIECFPKGILDVNQTVDYFMRLKNDARVKEGSIEIVYFNEVTDFRINFTESEEIAEKYQAAKSQQIIKATLFVCQSDLAYGIGRMLQTFHEISNSDHKVFVIRSETEIDAIVATL